jgi:hypothetical protein
MTEDQVHEWLTCSESPIYFIHKYCFVYDAQEKGWIPFNLWPAQAKTLQTLLNNLLVIILKARQLGMTWLVLGFALWLMLFRPAATVLMFSRRDDEAVHLLDFRLKGMYARLPDWVKCRAVIVDNAHEWRLSNGSMAFAFPTNAGDSYTATLAIVDEADLVPDLNRLMRAVKPTIDGGGQMILLSRADKSSPQSEFKAIYRAAKQGLSPWVSVFLPWWVRPSRDDGWYETQKSDIFSRTGSLDDLHEQYPATDIEALAARTLDKRLPGHWLAQCYQEMQPGKKSGKKLLSIPGLEVFRGPKPDRRYVIGADPAEGNPTSDDSALEVLDLETGEEVASLAGKFEPSTFASYIDQIGTWYNKAAVLPERNNHGHAVILWLHDNSALQITTGLDDKPGWMTNTKSKAMMYAVAADAFRDKETMVHSFASYTQLASIEGSTLRAPEGEHDDRATAYVLAIQAVRIGYSATGGINV